MDTLNSMMAFEDGTLSEEDTVKLFQELLNSGLVWKLQGFYGRTAVEMLDAGLIREKGACCVGP